MPAPPTPPSDPPQRGAVARQRSAQARNWLQTRMARAGLVRPASGGLVAGVLAGVAQRLGVSPWAARVVFLVSMFLPGPQILLYAVLWIAMPRA